MAVTLDSLRDPLECIVGAECATPKLDCYAGEMPNRKKPVVILSKYGQIMPSWGNSAVITSCLHLVCLEDLKRSLIGRVFACPICKQTLDKEKPVTSASDFFRRHFEAITQPTRTEQDAALTILYSDGRGGLLSLRQRLAEERNRVLAILESQRKIQDLTLTPSSCAPLAGKK